MKDYKLKEKKQRLLKEIATDAEKTQMHKGRSKFSNRVIDAVNRVPREHFLSKHQFAKSYDNRPLPIGYGQTISQPYIVALMTDLLNLTPTDKVLEIGTGCGYQTAILAELAHKIFTVELIPELHKLAKDNLTSLGYNNIQFCNSNGWHGWPDEAPYNKIIVTAAATQVPDALTKQLATDGKLLIPVGREYGTQFFKLIQSQSTEMHQESLSLPVIFVPLVNN